MEVLEFKLAFARLTPSHREVLVLHAVHVLLYEQVAEICGCEVGTVKSRINRARNLLKRMLLGETEAKHALRAPPMRARIQRKPISALVRQGRGRAGLTTNASTSQGRGGGSPWFQP